MRVLGIIPARGGSKGVPRKNIRLLAGKPLLAWTAEAALASRSLSRVILSTDDAEIAGAGRACGVDVPFLRPAELATDTTPTLPVLLHAVAALEQAGDRFDAICLLQPTNPLRHTEQIDEAIALLTSAQADSVISMLPVPPKFNPHWVYFPGADGFLHLSTGEEAPLPRRQDLPPAYHREGSLYVVRRDVLMNQQSLYGKRILGYLIDGNESVNVDTLDDWAKAEQMMSQLVLAGGRA